MNAGSKRLLATRYLKNENGNAIGMRDRYETTDRQCKFMFVFHGVFSFIRVMWSIYFDVHNR